MIQKDERMRLIVEMLKIMKIVKFYAWELAFKHSVDKIRKKELDKIKQFQLIPAIGFVISLSANPLVHAIP